ncbi:PREDICTED: phosphorylase b kinase regulatory subunit beta-like [Amphimedon queenslandica]|uniref:Phosphorylase b kinase regulatory subunit n=1 Tax=Amphimedon queenslandica TaxID=400682 RepID=A0A1X7VFM4_AMPQE|nr:PREDICTED: phosphorylase b kinase regulatory subunit beta-like [Amphimedon queenslandica]|eukprot:XP_019849301.1 PREDICTED: phosphorylase b kinase regulatory subunit beta-like [Amphimedon queenslandica]
MARSSDSLKREEKPLFEKLDQYYLEIQNILCKYQSHTLGLFPRGSSRHARVKDNVYCSMALWALSRAYSHIGYDEGRVFELQQSAVKCMRGILFCYMRQANKLESFKKDRTKQNALHSRFDCTTGNLVMDDNSWGHLQIDGTSLYLLVLAQMIASGVEVILSKDEVDFVQNLVYYIERAYRTPDFGMWEKETKDCGSNLELHASSIGMAKAALNAIHGLNLFGGGASSPSAVIHVDPDAQYRNHVILSTLLPRESSSRETDSALLTITGFPGFCIDTPELRERTETRVESVLEGKYGFKRFPKDVHPFFKDEHHSDIKSYEGFECEWPLFYLYTYISAMFRGETEKAERYWDKLSLTVTRNESGYPIVPKFYCYPKEVIKKKLTSPSLSSFPPDTQMISPDEPHPFLWSQSLYFIARLLRDKLLTLSELDPIGLHTSGSHDNQVTFHNRRINFHSPSTHRHTVVQVALICESSRLQSILAMYGIPTQTIKQIEPITLNSPNDVLLKVYSHLGENKKLGLSGRPMRPIGAIGTSKIYQILGQLAVFYPTDLSIDDFYMSYDIKLFIDTVKSTIKFLNSYWNMTGRPTLTLLLRQNLFQIEYFKDTIKFLAHLRGGEVGGVKVRLDRLQALVSTSCVDVLDCIGEGDQHDVRQAVTCAARSPRLRSRSSSLSTCMSSSLTSFPDDAGTPVTAGGNGDTLQIMRFEPGPVDLEEEPTYGPADLKVHSVDHLKYLIEGENNILGKIYLFSEVGNKAGLDYLLDRVSITDHIQNLYEEAARRKHWMAVRLAASILNKVVDCLAPSLSHLLVKEKEISIGVFGFPEYTITEPLTPNEIAQIMYQQCMPYQPIEAVLQQELLIYFGGLSTRSDVNKMFDGMLCFRLGWIIQAMKSELHRKSISSQILYQLSPYQIKKLLKETLLENPERTALYQRQLNGALNRVPPNFYLKVYGILKKASGGITVRGKTLPQYPTIEVLSGHEKSFCKKVDQLLSEIINPEYRQLVIELLMVFSTVLERNPELCHNNCINIDKLLQDAFQLLETDIENKRYTVGKDHDKTQHPFYSLPVGGTCGTITYMSRAVLSHLLEGGVDSSCSIS